MYYNRILRVWMLDPLDYFLISAFIVSIIASRLKEYLSEKAAMERLKNSIINESKLIPEKDIPILNSKEMKLKKIYKFALQTHGGQLYEVPDENTFELAQAGFKLAQAVKGVVERLAVTLKQRELKGIAKIFFKNGRLILELILHKCKIDITYSILSQGVNTQVIVMTASLGGAAGFTISWLSVGASLVTPPLLVSAFLLRNLWQQFLHQREYSNFKKILERMLDDDELKKNNSSILY